MTTSSVSKARIPYKNSHLSIQIKSNTTISNQRKKRTLRRNICKRLGISLRILVCWIERKFCIRIGKSGKWWWRRRGWRMRRMRWRKRRLRGNELWKKNSSKKGKNKLNRWPNGKKSWVVLRRRVPWTQPTSSALNPRCRIDWARFYSRK